MKNTFSLIARQFILIIWLLLAGVLARSTAQAQYIKTIIGNGVGSCYLDSLPALCIPIAYPQGVSVAANGDVYFACGNSVKRLNSVTGIVSRVAGSDSYGSSGNGGPAIDAMFQAIKAVKLDKKGNLYLAEYGGFKIRKINLSTGIVSAFAGTGATGFSGDGSLAINAQISRPLDIAIDDDGNVFIADYHNNRIRKVDAATGIISTFAGTGINGFSGDGGLAINAKLAQPNSLCFDSKGNLYFTENDFVSCRLRRIDRSTGVITTLAGNSIRAHTGDGGPAVNASLLEPVGVVVDSSGNIYVSEYVESRVRRIDASTGLIQTIAGTGMDGFGGDFGLAVNASFSSPYGLSFDNEGNLIICDSRNNRIRKLYLNAAAPPIGRPTIAISSPSTVVCTGDGIKFEAATTYSVAGSKFVWTKNGKVVGGDSSVWTGTDLFSGDTIQCNLQYLDCAGTIVVESNKIVLSGRTSQPLSVVIEAKMTSVCEGDTMVFNAMVSGGNSSKVFRWKVNNTVVGVNTSDYKTTGLSNGDTVSCEVETMTGPPCFVGGIAKSNLITVTIRSSNVPTVDIDASALKICSGTSVNFNAKLQDSDTTYRIQWKLNGADAGSNSNLFVTRNLKDGDKVGFVLTSIYGCFPPIPSDMLTISVEDLPVVRIFPSDTIVSYGATVNLRASVLDSVVSYSWTPVTSLSDPRVSNPITYPLVKSTTFTVTAVSAGNCANSATGIVRVEQKLIMPNAFTPNDDAKNDLFRIPPSVTMKLESFSIFNIWGERIFFTANRDEGWNGKVKGVLQNSGTYIYIVVGSDADGPIYLKGTFSLIR